MSVEKRVLIKALKLEKCLRVYQGTQKEEEKNTVIEKFVSVWGPTIAGHFLIKYDDAESLIWALDSVNLELFIEKF